MTGKVRITEVTGGEPVTVSDLREHLRLTVDMATAEHLGQLIATAREWVEDRTWLTLRDVTAEVRWDGFPGQGKALEIPILPVRDIVSVEYLDAAGETQTLATSDYNADLFSEPARISARDGWPTTDSVPNAVTVTVTAGYEAAPAKTRQAILLLAGHWYEHREEVVTGTISRVPIAAMDLCDSINRRAVS